MKNRLPRKKKKEIKKHFGIDGYFRLISSMKVKRGISFGFRFLRPGIFTNEIDMSYVAGIDVSSEDTDSVSVNLFSNSINGIHPIDMPIHITSSVEMNEVFGNIDE